jgi:hypothetical protein
MLVRRLLRLFVVLGCLIVEARAAAPTDGPPKFAPEQIEFFEKRVRPVLAAKCVECHGPKAAEAGLRLDSRKGVLHGMEGSPAAVPGDPAKSRIIAAIKYDGDVQMPPDGKLRDDEVAALTNWVKLGLPWPEETASSATASSDETKPAAPSAWGGSMDERIRRARAEHWAFQPVRKPQLPQVADAAWSQNPIDRFVLQKLDEAGLKHSPPADPATLIRRLYIDLIGLPPSAEEVEKFVQSYSITPSLHHSAEKVTESGSGGVMENEKAYAALVDKLLASPRYGERWARHWLDVARYADTKGYAFQQERRYPFAYTYRDYVVRAFNDDLPYDQFILEQLAADKLPPQPDNRHLAAMGFITCGRIYQGLHDTLDDQIDVVTRGLLGLSVSCARCHDHKFDPIPTDDYYSLYGVFRSSLSPNELPKLGEPKPSPEYEAFLKDLAKLEAARDAYLAEHSAKLADELRRNVRDYLGQLILERHEKSSVKEFEFVFDAGDPRPLVVTRWRNFVNGAKKKPDAVWRAWAAFDAIKEAEFEAKAPGVVAELTKAAKPSEPQYVNRLIREALAKKPPQRMLDVAELYGDLFERVYIEALPKATGDEKANVASIVPQPLADADAESLRQILYRDGSPVKLSSDETVAVFDRKTRDDYKKLQTKIDEFVVLSPAAPPRAMVLVDSPKPFDPQVFLRGDASRPERAVPRQFPRILAGDERVPFADGSGRLGLAKAIASRDNPLTARVLVNRVWMLHFGRGLVDTPSDFGVRTPPPSHPELLDYLAAEFMDEGWSIKRLHKLIVTSQTYRQASAEFGVRSAELQARTDNAALSLDPENRLLWRMNRRRLEFEAMRDALLVAGGSLDATSFGRPVDLWSQPYTARRSVYGFIDRQDLPGVFGVFDFANPDVTIDQRPRTSVPQQALFAMNSPFVQEQARRAAARAEVAQAQHDRARATALVRAVLGRSPSTDEADRLVRFVADVRKLPANKQNNPWQYGTGEFDAEAGRLKSFTLFPHWTGTSWQGSEKIPDPKLGYASLQAPGGHPGGPKFAVVLRWVSPFAGKVTLDGELRHNAKGGDGVAAHLTSSRHGKLGSWSAHRGEGKEANSKTNVAEIDVQPGDVIDLIVESRKSTDFDAYKWNPVLKAVSFAKESPAQAAAMPNVWNAADDFHGPLPPPLTPWEMLAQVLLMSNEFMFVD